MMNVLWVFASLVASQLSSLPQVRSSQTQNGSFVLDMNSTLTLQLDSQFADARDYNGSTLIPPSASEFAQTFAADLQEWYPHLSLNYSNASMAAPGGIFMTLSNATSSTLGSGQHSNEGYQVNITAQGITVTGISPLGMFWGTRTLLQQMFSHRSQNQVMLPAQLIDDAPSFSTRGFMLDAGRKYYSPDFLTDLCTYASFFKVSEFHLHCSDNVNVLNPDDWQNLYARFRLLSNDSYFNGLATANESYDRTTFDTMQQKCAARGVTIIPEIEAPGHALVISKWKPELRILNQPDLLNLSYPDTFPTMKRIWQEFLPWFHSKQVSIGADEYNSTYANDYITFVNNMSTFISQQSGKQTRAWGTYEPSNNSMINKDVVIQQWTAGQSDPVLLINESYTVINSQDNWAYAVSKNVPSQGYSSTINASHIFAYGPSGEWNPYLFNDTELTGQAPVGTPFLQGAITPLWNDPGPNASTQLEAYYALKEAIPLVASKAWTGASQNLSQTAFDAVWQPLAEAAPGQNLERSIPSSNENGLIVSYINGSRVSDLSGNGYSVLNNRSSLVSKGLNYTASIEYSGPFMMSSADATLQFTSNGTLVFTTDNYAYSVRAVNSTIQRQVAANSTSLGNSDQIVRFPLSGSMYIKTDQFDGTRLWSNGAFVGRVEEYRYLTVPVWEQMAFVMPLTSMMGSWTSFKLWEGIKDDL